jgi:DNA-directed RNA polymerase subunit K/omega
VLETDGDVADMKKIVDHRKKLIGISSGVQNRLSKYELTAIIGFRAQQLAEGAPPYVKVRPGMDPISVAIDEFDHDLIPLVIERPIPANKIGRFKYETYRLDELLNVAVIK